jgi:hypothetical protein
MIKEVFQEKELTPPGWWKESNMWFEDILDRELKIAKREHEISAIPFQARSNPAFFFTPFIYCATPSLVTESWIGTSFICDSPMFLPHFRLQLQQGAGGCSNTAMAAAAAATAATMTMMMAAATTVTMTTMAAVTAATVATAAATA